MQVSATSIAAMSAARTPEEAYKIFADAASEGLTKLLAEALAKALGSASVATTNPAIAGWEKLVAGIALDMVWGTPDRVMPPSVKIGFAPAVLPAGANPTIAGGSITIGGTWTF